MVPDDDPLYGIANARKALLMESAYIIQIEAAETIVPKGV